MINKINTFRSKYGRMLVFIIGVLLILSSVLMHIDGERGYSFFDARRSNQIVNAPFWMNYVLGVFCLFLGFKRKWFKR